MGGRECPQCGAEMPLSSTALVCRGCIARLAQALRFLPAHLAELEWTIGQGTVTDEHRGPGTITAPVAAEGPWCPAFDEKGEPVPLCPHSSCHWVFDSQDAAARWFAQEQPMPHEGALPVSPEAIEARDVAVSTITAWKRAVPGGPRLPARSRPAASRRRRRDPWESMTPLPPAADRPSRCSCCDLPLYSCHRRRVGGPVE